MKNKTNVFLGICIFALLSTLILVPATNGMINDKPENKEQVRLRIETGFRDYLSSNNIDANATFPTATFNAFVDKNPIYKEYIQKYTDLYMAEDFARFSSIPDISAVAQEGPVYKTVNVTQNDGEIVKVKLSNGTMTNGVIFTKATLCTEGTDPWVYIMMNKISMQILWWQINYGEHDYIGMCFPNYGNGTDEGTTFMGAVDDWANNQISYNSYVMMLLGVGAGIAIPLTQGVSIVAGIGEWLVGELSAQGWNNLRSEVIDTYDSVHGVWFCMENFFFYPWWTAPGGGQTYYTRNWDDYPQTGPWEEVPGLQVTYDDLFTGGMANACILSDAIKTAGDAYGYNQWVGLAYDQTPKIIDPPYPCLITVLGYDDSITTPVGLFDVYIDSQYVGYVDAWQGLSYSVEAGEHTISITTSGYNTYGDSYLWPTTFWYFDTFSNPIYNNQLTITTSNDVTVIAHFYP